MQTLARVITAKTNNAEINKAHSKLIMMGVM